MAPDPLLEKVDLHNASYTHTLGIALDTLIYSHLYFGGWLVKIWILRSLRNASFRAIRKRGVIDEFLKIAPHYRGKLTTRHRPLVLSTERLILRYETSTISMHLNLDSCKLPFW
jgi:hypothetical protein